MKISQIIESKTNVMSTLKNILWNSENPENMFVTLTDIPKVGINPKSDWSTPTGVYVYPLEYVTKLKYLGELPFAGDAKYVNVLTLKPNAKIIDVSDFTTLQQVGEYYGDVESVLHFADKHGIKDAPKLFWELSRFLSNGHTVKWNKLFRGIGIDVVSDKHGTATIHKNEPTQAVILNPRIIDKVQTFHNNSASKTENEIRINTYKHLKSFLDSRPSEDDIVEFFEKYKFDSNIWKKLAHDTSGIREMLCYMLPTNMLPDSFISNFVAPYTTTEIESVLLAGYGYIDMNELNANMLLQVIQIALRNNKMFKTLEAKYISKHRFPFSKIPTPLLQKLDSSGKFMKYL